ncbi:MAG: T9SS type A sorting domain-containing protein [Rubricoccaceae bacterium]|nr:T9SS type A sorting domain-containing protein [Rubricoccaceae bacterium]
MNATLGSATRAEQTFRMAALAACWILGGAVADVRACPSTTGEDATVVIAAEALAPGAPLADGDILRAVTPEGECVGEATWSDEGGAALTLWGDDITTAEQEGAEVGEAFALRAVRGSEEIDLAVDLAAVLSAPQGTGAEYVPDAIYLVRELGGSSPTASEPDMPGGYVLSQARPNPVVVTSALTLQVAQTQHVSVAVYDVLGRCVSRLHEGTLESGSEHRLLVGASDLASGAYLVRVDGEQFAATRSLTVLR